MRTRLLAAVSIAGLIAACSSSTSAPDPLASPTLTGSWKGTVQIGIAIDTITATLNQAGGGLTGTWSHIYVLQPGVRAASSRGKSSAAP